MTGAIVLTLWSLVVIGTVPDKPVVTGVVTRDFSDQLLCESVAKDLSKHAGIVRAKCFPK